MAFSKEVVKMLFDQNGQTLLADGGGKKGTLIFTGTLGAMRTNANFAAYGASRSGGSYQPMIPLFKIITREPQNIVSELPCFP